MDKENSAKLCNKKNRHIIFDLLNVNRVITETLLSGIVPSALTQKKSLYAKTSWQIPVTTL